MTKMTLLEKAIALLPPKSRKANFSNEELELIEAWLNGKVGHGQVSRATGRSSTALYSFLATGAHHLWMNGGKK